MLLTIQIDTDKYILVPRVPTKEIRPTCDHGLQ
jgi:hypothetical protein